jgi:hypothetical protein
MELKNHKLTKGRLWEAQAGTLEKESLKNIETRDIRSGLGLQLQIQRIEV